MSSFLALVGSVDRQYAAYSVLVVFLAYQVIGGIYSRMDVPVYTKLITTSILFSSVEYPRAQAGW